MRSRPMSLLASALFLVLAPGVVGVYMPWAMTRWRPGSAPPSLDAVRLAGFALAVIAAGVLLDAFFRFAWFGRGSPAPVMPPDMLVVSGFYRRVRNPMYLAVLAMIFGQALWLWRGDLAIYGLIVAVAFVGFVRLYEEPHLKKRFGAQYNRYCRHVPRWIPRFRAWDPEAARYRSFLER